MPTITEVAPDTYRLSIYVPEIDLQFNHFLIRDEEPLLFTTGYRAMFPELREAVATLIDPARLRWFGFSYFESDECGSLNQWLEVAPDAQPVCGLVGAQVSVNDYAIRPARGLAPDESLVTGKYRYRFRPTPHLPHGWDAGVFFEETERTLLCSDLLFHLGDVEPLIESDVVERSRASLLRMEETPLAGSIPYTSRTEGLLRGLADLKPKTLALGHGSSFVGNGEYALREFHRALWETFGRENGRSDAATQR